nr:hypothetical protein [Candidatus Methanodesulfokores washburnensis]
MLCRLDVSIVPVVWTVKDTTPPEASELLISYVPQFVLLTNTCHVPAGIVPGPRFLISSVRS